MIHSDRVRPLIASVRHRRGLIELDGEIDIGKAVGWRWVIVVIDERLEIEHRVEHSHRHAAIWENRIDLAHQVVVHGEGVRVIWSDSHDMLAVGVGLHTSRHMRDIRNIEESIRDMVRRWELSGSVQFAQQNQQHHDDDWAHDADKCRLRIMCASCANGAGRKR